MLVLGLTGSIGMGKSVAATMLRRMGLPLHDSDRAVHRLLAKGGGAVAEVEAAFSGVVVDGAVDRGRLAERVFEDPEALARLEAEWPGEVLLVTQNIDDLHERAGSRNLLHMHGEILKARCQGCREVTPWAADMDGDTLCPACGRAGGLRIHVVWFGEMPFEMDRILGALEACDLFVSIGTSGSVYPAAGFVAHVGEGGLAHTAELNLEPSEGATLFAEAHYGPATEVVPAYVDRILEQGW